MFGLEPHPSAPFAKSKSRDGYQLGPDRGLPPPLQGDRSIYLVECISDEDPANAKSWPLKRKLRSAVVLGITTLVASWGSSVYSAAIPAVMIVFGVSHTVAVLGLTL